MNLDELLKRVRKASDTKSLRAVAELCDVSHEQIRKLVKAKETPNITLDTFNKINEGLKQNGF